jgi:hypothetical protein
MDLLRKSLSHGEHREKELFSKVSVGSPGTVRLTLAPPARAGVWLDKGSIMQEVK